MTSVSQDEALELEQLKQEANELGVKFSDNISAATLSRRISTHKETAQTVDEVEETKPEVITSPVQETAMSVQDEIRAEVALEQEKTTRVLSPRQEALRLVRVIVTPIDTAKRDYEGEIFSVGNSFVPTVRKFVQFNVPTHLENILYNQLVQKDYQYFVTRKRADGSEYREAKIGKAYSVQVLPPLTKAELKALADSQHARNAIDK